MALYAKDKDGNVYDVAGDEVRVVTLDEINAHIQEWQDRKAEFEALTGTSDQGAAASDQGSADQGQSVATDQSATPVDQTAQAPVQDASAPVAPVADPNAAQAPVAPVAPQQVDPAQPQVQTPVFPQ